MIEPTAIEHAVVVAFTVVYPLWGALTWPAFVRAARAGAPGVRMRAYVEILVVQWTLTALLLWSWLGSGRPWAMLGLSMPSLAGWIGLGLAALQIVWLLSQRHRLERMDAEVVATLRKDLGDTALLLPHTLAERRLFRAVSVTAGVCEEVTYRGLLPLYLLAWGVPSPWAVFVAVAAFGVAHAYQGPRGIFKTTIVGALLALVAWWTDSLWTSIVLHATTDLHAGAVGYAFLRRQAELEAEAKPAAEPESPTA